MGYELIYLKKKANFHQMSTRISFVCFLTEKKLFFCFPFGTWEEQKDEDKLGVKTSLLSNFGRKEPFLGCRDHFHGCFLLPLVCWRVYSSYFVFCCA